MHYCTTTMRRTPNRDASPPGEHLPLVHGSSAKPAVARESLWYHSSFLIMAEAMGMGVLGIPHATAQIGWVWVGGTTPRHLPLSSPATLARLQPEAHHDAASEMASR